MKPIHVAATVVRLFAICLVISSISYFINSVIFYVNSDIPLVSILSIAIPVVQLILSIVLWYFPVSISRKITGIPLKNDDEELSFKNDEFLSICIFVLGLYFLYGLIGQLTYWISFINDPVVSEPHTELTLDQKASLWAMLFKSIFVFLLLAGNRLIIKIYKALKYGGQ